MKKKTLVMQVHTLTVEKMKETIYHSSDIETRIVPEIHLKPIVTPVQFFNTT